MPYHYPLGGTDFAGVELSARHLTAQSVEEVDEETGEKRLVFYLGDEDNAAEIISDFGDPEVSARCLLDAADKLRQHAELIRSRERLRTAGWT